MPAAHYSKNHASTKGKYLEQKRCVPWLADVEAMQWMQRSVWIPRAGTLQTRGTVCHITFLVLIKPRRMIWKFCLRRNWRQSRPQQSARCTYPARTCGSHTRTFPRWSCIWVTLSWLWVFEHPQLPQPPNKAWKAQWRAFASWWRYQRPRCFTWTPRSIPPAGDTMLASKV